MIAPDTIALVKERTDLVALIGEHVRLQKRGRTFVGLCPFHKEKSPSFHVSPERGFFHCFGCKESGSAVDFLMKAHGMAFVEAVRELAQRAGVEIVEQHSVSSGAHEEARRAKEDLYAVNHLAALFYERSLGVMDDGARHPLAHHALAELEKRGMPGVGDTSGDRERWLRAVTAFRVGYAPHGWDLLATFLRDQGVSAAVAERAGLLVPRSSGTGHYDRFRHRLMFAVIDVLGRVVAFSGRALDDPSPAELERLGRAAPRPSTDGDHKPAKYVNSPESPIYEKGQHVFGLYQARQAVRQSGMALLVEGNFDVLSLHARGEERAVAPLGTAFTAGQARLIKRFAPSVTVLFDGDVAGRKATRAARAACREGELEAKVATLPAGSDPDDFARLQGIDALARVVQGARGMLEFLIDDALDGGGFGAATFGERIARVRAVARLLSEENDPNLRAMAKLYADQLSSKLVIGDSQPADLRQLERLIEEATSRSGPLERSAEGARPGVPGPGASPGPGRAEPRRPRGPAALIAEAIVGALLDFPHLLDDPEVCARIAAVEGDAALAIAALRQNRAPNKGLYAAEFLAQAPSSIHSFAAGRLACPVFEDPSDARSELVSNTEKLKGLSHQRENAAAVEELKRGGASTEEEDALLLSVVRRKREKLGLD